MSLEIPQKRVSTDKVTCLVDGDILVYRCGFAVSDDEPATHAYHLINTTINSILEACDTTKYKVYLTGKGNFREQIATIKPYKGNRTGRKPVHYDSIRQFLIDHHQAELVEGIEADDAMSIESCQNEGKCIICTLDKDLDMVPGKHYNWVKDKMYDISQFQGYYNFYFQLLTGDTVDNIQGIPGIGPKKAEKILDGCQTVVELQEAVQLEYYNHFDDLDPDEIDDIMIENGTLLWMMRDSDTEFRWPE